MRWMGWSYDDLYHCPGDLVDTVIEMIEELGEDGGNSG